MINSKLIAEAQKALDEADVPTKGREIHFIGKDGNPYMMRTDEMTPYHIVKQIPEWMKDNG